MRNRLRLALSSHAVAVGAVAAGVLLGLGLPLAARRGLDGRALATIAATAGVAVAGASLLLLARWVGGPVERLLRAAERIRGADGLPPLGPPGDEGGPSLARAALAFERTAAALGDERARLAAKVRELEDANAKLAEAREGLLRSERLAAIGRLAAGVAHEVGNPLGAITGYAELARSRLERAGGSPEAIEFVGRIAAETARIDTVVRDLLDFARPSSLALVPVEVGAALEAALRLARVQERFRRVEVRVELAAGLPRVRADERRLAQVFLNLLLNAGDAMGGGGRVTVAGREAGSAVEVAVADSGPGIAAADLPRIFDPFFTTKPPGQGTGLGLAVCDGILRSFGGEISAESGPAGATFRLRLLPSA